MRNEGRMETEDIILAKAKYEDWRSIYRNVWSRLETAKYMVWKVTADEDGARERIQRTIAWQETHDAWMVYERGSGQAIGFAGVKETEPHVFHETGIALGPEYVGRGYGKQILRLLMEYCISLEGQEFYYSTRAGNTASRALALSCGFTYQHSERRIDQCSGKTYELEIYKKNLGRDMKPDEILKA
ncbi:GNAT family N-acetyltransferase [Lachnospiraceae bacterium 47-T17]